jgi:ABC-type multidrug transport system ATPase subunit
LQGTMTALLGASGAGKSTLLDVLAFRKTSGIVTGALKLNGQPATHAMLSSTSGYSEQSDVHVPQATVREALDFSAALRLPPSLHADERNRIVDGVLALLELAPVAGRLVSSLGASESKRLTLGVELAANVPILFCDEPTTGLDSRAAAVIMRVLRRVALSGRTVVATIHAPSAEIFFSFDRAIVLSRGVTTYAGAIGHHAHEVAKFYAAVPGVRGLPPHVNPATWLLEIQGEGHTANIDFAAAYASSALAARNTATVSELVAAGGSAPGDHEARASTVTQMYELLVRSWTILWREGNYGVSRTYGILGVSVFYGLLFLVVNDTFAGVQSRFGSILAASA